MWLRERELLAEIAHRKAVNGSYSFQPDDYEMAHAEARRLQAEGAPLPDHRQTGATAEFLEFYRAVKIISKFRLHLGRHPVHWRQRAGEPRHNELTFTETELCLTYLKDFFNTMIREYRALIGRNFGRIAPELPTFRGEHAYVRVRVHPIPQTAPTGWDRREVFQRGSLWSVPNTAVSVTWAPSPSSEDLVEVTGDYMPESESVKTADRWTVESPIGDLPVAIHETKSLATYFGDGALVRNVYELLDNDLRSYFGWKVWPHVGVWLY
jgi:hypothetical protein